MPIDYFQLVIEEFDYRVFLANTGRDIKKHAVHAGTKYSADWVGQFVLPGYTREECKTWVPMHSWAFERLIQWAGGEGSYLSRADGLIDEAVRCFVGNVPDSNSLQAAFEGAGYACRCTRTNNLSPLRTDQAQNVAHPDSVVRKIQELIEKWFPRGEFEGIKTPKARYKNELMTEAVLVQLPIRIVAALACCGLACEEANRGDAWHRTFYCMKGKPKMAGCLFAHGVYLYRRHTKATIEQIATVLRIPTWE